MKSLLDDQFDPEWYLRNYVDVAKSGMDPLEHFKQYGQAEGRGINSMTAGFDPAFYLSQYTDVAKAGVDPLMHYLQYGQLEGRRKNAEDVPQSFDRSTPTLDPNDPASWAAFQQRAHKATDGINALTGMLSDTGSLVDKNPELIRRMMYKQGVSNLGMGG